MTWSRPVYIIKKATQESDCLQKKKEGENRMPINSLWAGCHRSVMLAGYGSKPEQIITSTLLLLRIGVVLEKWELDTNHLCFWPCNKNPTDEVLQNQNHPCSCPLDLVESFRMASFHPKTKQNKKKGGGRIYPTFEPALVTTFYDIRDGGVKARCVYLFMYSPLNFEALTVG